MENIPFGKTLILDALDIRYLRHPGDYTRRSYTHNGVSYKGGALNIVERLPACSVKPDLGPKLYIAYSRSEDRKLEYRSLHSSRSTHQSGIEKSRNDQSSYRCVRRTEYSGLCGYRRAWR